MSTPAPVIALDVKPSIDAVIGENVQILLMRTRQRQAELALALGLTQPALSNKLRGKRPWFAAEIDGAARHFGVTRDSLFEWARWGSNPRPAD